MNTLPYFLTASLYLALFIGFYGLLLRRNTFFRLNRIYLLTSVVLSLLLPLAELPVSWWVEETRTPVRLVTLPTFVITAGDAPAGDGLTPNQWLWLIYSLGVVVRLLWLGFNLYSVFRLIRQGHSERRPGYTLVHLPDDKADTSRIPSFSFGRYLVLNPADAQTPGHPNEPDALMRHEEAHIRQYHTADVLLIELVWAGFWFNPVIWLYKRALQEVHEFLADRAASEQATSQTARADYARQLVAYALNVPSAALTTPFVSVSTLKQRVRMLQKPQSNRRALLGYALVLPLAGLLTLCTQPDRDQPRNEAGLAKARTPVRAIKVEGKIYDAVEDQPEFPGGIENLMKYLGENLKYPAAAVKANASGRVFVNFIVTKDGDITDVKVLKGIGFGADEEAVRVVSQMPRWKPARQDGQVVNVRYNLPINFQLDEKKDKVTQTQAKEEKQPPFSTFSTDDADIQRQYKHFVVDGKEVSYDEFKTYGKDAIIEASSSEQTIRIQTVPPPPPPPVPANDASALNDVKHVTIDGKQATKAEVAALSPNAISRVDVNKAHDMLAVTTK